MLHVTLSLAVQIVNTAGMRQDATIYLKDNRRFLVHGEVNSTLITGQFAEVENSLEMPRNVSPCRTGSCRSGCPRLHRLQANLSLCNMHLETLQGTRTDAMFRPLLYLVIAKRSQVMCCWILTECMSFSWLAVPECS